MAGEVEFQGGGESTFLQYGGGMSGGYIPPHIDKALGDGLGTISACGASNVTSLIYAGLVTVLCIYLIKRNGSLVDQVLNLIPQASATISKAVENFEEKVDVLIQIFKKN